MSDFLSTMAASSLLRADGVRTGPGASELERRARSAGPTPGLQLSEAGFDLIAEAKLASPSEGRIVDADESSATTLRQTALELARAGASALSILTEPTAFSGGIEHLQAVAPAVNIPVMRKDFLVDPIQILEARAGGASGVLLIARMLDQGQLSEMTDLALDLSMFVLLEVFDLSDLDLAAGVFDRQLLIGVNCRDLETLRVESRRHADLIPHLPSHLPAVAESGLTTPADAARMADLGYRLALVGSSLMRSPSPGEATAEMIAAGRRQVGIVS